MITLHELINLLNQKNNKKLNNIDYKFNLGVLLSSSYVAKNYNEKKKKKKELSELKKSIIKNPFKDHLKDIFAGISCSISSILFIYSSMFIFLFTYDFFTNGNFFNDMNYFNVSISILCALTLSWFIYKIPRKRELEIYNREKETRSMFINKYLSDKESEKKLVEESLSLINELENIKSNYNQEIVDELRSYLIEETYELQNGNDSELFENVRENIAHQVLVNDINSKRIAKNKKIESKKIITNENKNHHFDVENKFNLILKNTNKDIWDFEKQK